MEKTENTVIPPSSEFTAAGIGKWKSGSMLAVLLAVHALLIRRYFFVCDDAYISFRYLINWLSGHGLVYNIGERVEGYTNLLWILILAPLARAGALPERAAPIMSAVFSLCLVGLVFYFPRMIRGTKWPWWAAAVAPALLVLNRSYNIWATGGLETRLFTLLVFTGLAGLLRNTSRRSRWNLILAGLFFGMAELTRPEALLLGPLAFVLYGAAELWRRENPQWLHLAAGAGLFIIICLIHFTWRYSYYGFLLPNTYYVKVDKPWFDMGNLYLLMFCIEYGYFIYAPMLIVSLIISYREKDAVILILSLFPIPYLIYVASLGGDHFEYRLLDPLLPVLALLISFSFFSLWSRLSKKYFLSALAVLLSIYFVLWNVLFPLSTSFGWPDKLSPMSRPVSDPARIIGLARLPLTKSMADYYNRHYATLVSHLIGIRWEEHRLFVKEQEWEAGRMLDFLERGYIKKSETICVQAAGVVPYKTGLWTLDYFGLTDVHVAHKKIGKHSQIAHDKSAEPQYIKDRGIDYVAYQYLMHDPAEYDHKLPVLKPTMKEFDSPDQWFGKLYLGPTDEAFFVFFSTREPADILSRFKERGLPVFLYIHKTHETLYPVPLEQALK